MRSTPCAYQQSELGLRVDDLLSSQLTERGSEVQATADHSDNQTSDCISHSNLLFGPLVSRLGLELRYTEPTSCDYKRHFSNMQLFEYLNITFELECISSRSLSIFVRYNQKRQDNNPTNQLRGARSTARCQINSAVPDQLLAARSAD